MQPPATFGPEFLSWLRDASERAWGKLPERTLQDFVDAGFVGATWRPGTRWGSGLPAAEIDAIEERTGVRFPPDYRLFLATLHTTLQPQTGVTYAGDEPRPYEPRGFRDWTAATAEWVRDDANDVYEGLAFDVGNGLWLPEWGERPAELPERLGRLRALVDAAPRLVRVYGHRFLLVEPMSAGNPVLSVHQSDVIVYGADLRAYLLNELASGLGREFAVPAEYAPFERIPFWGPLLRGAHRSGERWDAHWDPALRGW